MLLDAGVHSVGSHQPQEEALVPDQKLDHFGQIIKILDKPETI